MSENIYFVQNVPIPEEDAREISLRAAQLVRQNAPRGQNNSRRLVRATWQKGSIGLVFPEKASHLLYIDRGIKPFMMYELEGKTIPIRGQDGKLSFRVAKNVGRSQISSRNSKGQIEFSKKRWRHPGIKPQNFVDKAFQQALKEYLAKLKGKDIVSIMKQAEGEAGEFFNRFLSTDSTEYQKMRMEKKYVHSTGKNSPS